MLTINLCPTAATSSVPSTTTVGVLEKLDMPSFLGGRKNGGRKNEHFDSLGIKSELIDNALNRIKHLTMMCARMRKIQK